MFEKLIYLLTAVFQWKTSRHKSDVTKHLIALFCINVTLHNKVCDKIIFSIEIIAFIKSLKSTLKRSYDKQNLTLVVILTLNVLMATKVVCFSRLLKCLRSLYGKQRGPRSDCSYRSSLIWVHAVCFYT